MAPTAPAKTAPAAKPGDTRPITFDGRTLTVALPSGDQLAVWQRTSARFAAAAARQDTLTNDEAMRLLERGMRVIESVLVGDGDRDWLEDQILDGNLTLAQAGRIISDALAAFGTKTAPKTGPVKRARRAAR